MSKSHSWFGTQSDAELIIDWLQDAGARQLNGSLLARDWIADGQEWVLHFPSIGPVQYWPENITAPQIGDNSHAAKRAILASHRQRENPGRRQIDVDRSAVAGLKLPELRDDRYWVAGHTWFPTTRLKDAFPELNRVCSRFERFLKKFEIVFDNTKGSNKSTFDFQICAGGVVQRIYALPEAFELLKRGAFMVDSMTSPKSYQAFRIRLQLAGYE